MTTSESSESPFRSGAGGATRNRKVLVVDDEQEIADQIARYLERHGFDCERAYGGGDALQLAREDADIAIVLTDIRMPGIDGLELAEGLREAIDPARHLQVIIMTGYAGLDQAIKAVHLGAHDFLTKPVSLRQVLDTVRGADKAVRAGRLDDQYKGRLHDEVAKRDRQMAILRNRVEGLERVAAEEQSGVLAELREVLLPGLLEELVPSIELAHAMVALLGETEIPSAGSDDDHILGHLRVAIDESREGLVTVTDLVRVVLDDLSLTIQEVDLDPVVAAAVAAAADEAGGSGVNIVAPATSVGLTVRGDPEWLERAFVLLFSTASSLTPLGGTVRLSYERTSSGIDVVTDLDAGETADSGGAPADSGSAPVQTSGLGYALVRRLLPLMGGRLAFVTAEDGMPAFRVSLKA